MLGSVCQLFSVFLHRLARVFENLGNFFTRPPSLQHRAPVKEQLPGGQAKELDLCTGWRAQTLTRPPFGGCPWGRGHGTDERSVIDIAGGTVELDATGIFQKMLRNRHPALG